MADTQGADGERAALALGPAGLVAGYLFLVLAPLSLAWWTAPRGASFWPELATGLAFAGYAMLLVQFLLTGRFRFIGGRVGIDLVMRFHQLAARTLTVFLILHPLLYGAGRAWGDPASYLFSLVRLFTAAPFATGVAAWVGLVALVGVALWRPNLPITYEAWRVSHGAGALVIALLALHHALTLGGFSAAPPVMAAWVVLTAAAAATLVQVYLVRPLALARRPFRVAEVRALGPGRWLLSVVPEDGARLAFRAGQFAWLKLGPSPFTVNEHPFSMASAPAADGRIEFLIRETGDFTSTIGGIAPGTRAWLDGPHGAFVLDQVGEATAPGRVVLIAGGVGLAPILSILREAAGRGDRRSFHLVYGNRTEAQIVLRDELETLRDSFDLRIDYVLGEPPEGWKGMTGQLDLATLEPLLGRDSVAARGALYYLCGPPAMVTASERALAMLGVAPGRVIAERFEYD